MEDSTGDAFILNRYFMRQIEQQQNKRNYSKKSTLTRQPVFDVNANEYSASNEQLYDVTSGQSRCSNGDCHQARIYYDLPLCLNSSFSTEPATSPPKVDSVTFTRKTDIDSPSRSSHAKLPNCLRRKQQAIKSKHMESYLESKSTYSANIESLIDHELFRPNLIDPNSRFNECWVENRQNDIVPIEETAVEPLASNPKRIYDRRKRSHIRHIVKTTREKINQSLSTFRRSAKSRKPRFAQERRNGCTFFTNSYSDPDLHLSVQRLIEQKSSRNYEHFVMQCRETQFVLSRFSSYDNFFDEAYNETHDFENELNHAKRSFLRTNFLRRNKPISSQRDDLIKRYNQPSRVATERSSSSNETIADDSNDSDSEGEFIVPQSVLPHSNGHTEDLVKQSQVTSTCTPFDVPNWQELCERIYRFRIQLPPAQPLSWMESNQKIAHKESQPSIPEQRLDRDSLAPSLESITQSCHQELFSPSINSPATSQPNACSQLESLLQETSGPLEPKNKFDVEQFIRCVAKRIFALARESRDSVSLEAAIMQIDFSQCDDAFCHVNNLTVRAYKTFLMDLCKELTTSNFCTESNCSHTAVHFSLMLPLRSQKQPWPSTEDRFVQELLSQMKSLSVFKSLEKSPMSAKNVNCNDRRKCAQDVKRFGLMAYCRKQRKLDMVDSVLYREMLDNEHRWSFQGPEILQIKRQLLMGS